MADQENAIEQETHEDSKGTLTGGVILVVAILLAAFIHIKAEQVTSQSVFYHWIAAKEVGRIGIAKPAGEEGDQSDEDLLYARVSAKAQEICDSQDYGAFSELTDGDPARKWSVVKNKELDPMVGQFTDLLRNGRIEAISAGPIPYADMGVGTSLTQMLLGFRNMAANLLWIKGDEYFHKGYIHKMVPMILTVVKLDPHFIEAYSMGSWHLAYNITASFSEDEQDLVQDYINQGIELLEQGIRNNPRKYHLYFDLGFTMYYLKLEDYENAVVWIEQAAEKPDHEKYVPRMLFHAYSKTGRFEEAYNGWLRYLEANPDDESTEIAERFLSQTAALRLESAEQYDDAIAAWERFARLFPGSADEADRHLLTIDGIRLENEGKLMEAFQYWEDCFMQYPHLLDIAIEHRDKLAETIEKDRPKRIVLSVSPQVLELGPHDEVGYIDITNQGSGKWEWYAETDTEWLWVNPNTQGNHLETDRVTVEVFREGLEPGTHEAKVTITDIIGGEEAQDVTVRVEILPPPPDIS